MTTLLYPLVVFEPSDIASREVIRVLMKLFDQCFPERGHGCLRQRIIFLECGRAIFTPNQNLARLPGLLH